MWGILFPDGTPAATDVMPDVHPKSHDQINNQRGAHPDERGIDEIFADYRRRDVHFFAQVLTDPEGMSLNQIFKPVMKHRSLQ